MWDRWKNKIQNFIWKEVETESETEEDSNERKIDQHHDKKQPIQTRMVYQYPDKKPFKFPIIPDEPPEKMTAETPAYKRRKVERDYHKQYQKESQSHEESNKESMHFEHKPSRKIYKKDESRPFKPSRVASPIYGYQERRQDKEIHEVPAYLRKQRVVAEPETAENDVKTFEEEDKRLEHIESAEKESAVTKEYSYDETSLPQREEREKADVQTEKKESEIVSESIRRNTKHTEPKRTRSKPGKENVPFNVMMTPRDKKNLFDRKKEQQNAIQLNTEEEISMDESSQLDPFPNTLLDEPVDQSGTNDLWVEEQKGLLEKTLQHFKVRATVVNATQGPSVTRFEVKPELGVKVSRIRNLSDDLKLNMAAKDIRIEAPIPGKNTVGIEVPNPKPQMVGLQEIFETKEFEDTPSPLTIALGLNIEGAPIITNIQKMPHGLIAGATGSGKSVCINTILISLLYKASHEDVKFILIDPKMVELTQYNGIPHLVSPVITDVKAATAALKWAVNEMEERYEKFVDEGVRNIEKYNQKVLERGNREDKMPFIVIVIDELADLMMVSPQDVEDSISRIAQKARACGIHLLLATQRPSVDVITGLIKANIPTRIAFSVSSQVDSRTILDVGGAEKLLGKGDMLFVENGAGKSIRLQGAFVSDEEIDRVTNHARKIAKPNYLFEQDTLLEKMTFEEEKDELLYDAIDFVMIQNSASTSMLQRHFKIGYNRAARLIDTLEQKGIISSQNGSKPRDILITQAELEDIYTSQ